MILWLQTLTMEEIFILTGASVLLIGIAAGLLLAWIETRIERKSNMNILSAKKSDFYSLPKINWDANMYGKQFDSIIILPERRKHDSGYMCMSFVGCIGGEAVAIMGGGSDVLHFDGIGGYGKDWYKKQGRVPSMMPVKSWNIDCLPCGCLHIWASGRKIEIGSMLSSFEIYAERKSKNDSESET